MSCNAIKQNGQPCTYAAKDNGYCGIHKGWAEVTLPEADDTTTTNPEEEIKVEHNNSKRRRNNKKKENNKVEIFHYIEEVVRNGELDNKGNTIPAAAYIRHIETKIEREGFLERYRESQRTGMPSGNILAISTGDYHFSLIENIAAHKGIDICIKTVAVRTRDVGGARFLGLDAMRPHVYENLKANSNFYWANADNAYFVQFPGWDGWGLEPMGLKTQYVAKLTKRLAEVPRSVKFSLFQADGLEDLKMVRFNHRPDWDPIMVDGCIGISRKLYFRILAKSCSPAETEKYIRAYYMDKMTRHTFRGLFEGFMLKGHCVVIDELPGGADIMYHESARKADLGTDGWLHITLEPYGTFHNVGYDTQSIIGNREVLKEDKQMADLTFMYTDAINKLNLGELPEWLLDREEYHGPDAVERFGQERLDLLMSREYMKPQQYVIRGTDTTVSPKAWANLPYMAYNGMVERFNQAAVYQTDERGRRTVSHFDKYWTVCSNAFSAPVITHELLSVFGVTVGNNSVPVFHQRYGLVLPGKRFVATYDLHGGWDQDDSVPAYLVKIYGTPEQIEFLHEYDALDGRYVPARDYDNFSDEMKGEFIRVGETKEEAAWAMVLIRRPNGPGEYSIEVVRDPSEFNWYRFDPNHVPLVNLDSEWMAKPATYLKEQVVMGQLPEASLTYTREELTREQANIILEAQKINPGIGGMASAIMLWCSIFGVSFPEGMVDTLENCVDTTQSGHDPVLLQAVAESVETIHKNMVDRILNQDVKIDAVLSKIYKIGRGLDASDYQEIDRKKVNGRFTRFNNAYKAAINTIRQEITTKTFEMRSNDPLVMMVKQYFTNLSNRGMIDQSSIRWCKDMYDEMMSKFTANDRRYHSLAERTNRFVKLHHEQTRNQANRAVVDEAVMRFRNLGDDRTALKRVVLFWYWLQLPSAVRGERNRHDRVICAPGNDTNLLDLLLDGLEELGFISKKEN